MALASPCCAATQPLLPALDHQSASRSTATPLIIFTAVVAAAAATVLSAKHYLSASYLRVGLVGHRTRFDLVEDSYYGFAENEPISKGVDALGYDQNDATQKSLAGQASYPKSQGY
jgi:hypothetical protein